MVAILLIGLLAYRLLPVSALPRMDFPVIQIVTYYPGASPDVMATSVTAPLEKQLGRIPGLRDMTSKSAEGVSVIVLEFDLNQELATVEQDVQAAINVAVNQLPQSLPYLPVYHKVNPADPAIMTLALTSETLPLSEIHRMAETRLIAKLSQVSGVGQVTISGGQRPAIRIEVNPNAFAAYKISLEDVRLALKNANSNMAKGSFDGKTQASFINTNDQLLSVDEFKQLIIAFRNGAAVRLKDVAKVREGVENVRLAGWADNQPALIVHIYRQPDANVIQVVDRIKQLMPQLRETMPRAVNLTVLSDRTENIRASIHDVKVELLLAVVLVVVVILLFLQHIKATLIPAIVVPLSVIGTFSVMYALGFSINNLTLMALIIATGFVVDDAIVMIENIMRHMEEGLPPLQAAIRGAKQISFTIISLTVSLIAVLVPILFMGGVIGRLFHEFAMTLAVAILISAAISLTLTPMMCATILKQSGRQKLTQFHPKEAWFERLTRYYGHVLSIVLRHRFVTLTVALFTLGLTVWLYIYIPKGFFPVQDTALIRAVTLAPPTVSFTEMAKRQQALSEQITQDPDVIHVSSFIGVDESNLTLNSGQMLIHLTPVADRSVSVTEVIARLQQAVKAIPGITIYMQPVQDLTINTQISATQYQLSLQGIDQAELDKWVPVLTQAMQQSPLFSHVISDQQSGGLEVYIKVNRDVASQLGINQTRIDNTLYSAYGQRRVSSIFTLNNQQSVIMEVLPEFRRDPSALNKLYISGDKVKRSRTGPDLEQQVPLASISEISERQAPLLITRKGQIPAATISFDLAPGIALGQAVTQIKTLAEQSRMPDSVSMQFQGAAQAFVTSLTNQKILLLAAIITVYIILGILYESFIHPLTILSSLPSAAVGALLALKYTGGELNVISIIGIILLIGIVLKNAIMMIDFALDAQRNEHISAAEAIFQACLLRFRPIIMTTMAALLAALPLAFSWGAGAELRQPLGMTMIGGLILSQMMTLFTTPVIYLLLEQFRPSSSHRVP